jgi:hypothetical protein
MKRAKKVRDLWTHKDLSGAGEGYSAQVSAHGVAMLRVSK